MIHVSQQQQVTVIQFEPEYGPLDQERVEQAARQLAQRAKSIEPPLMVFDLSETPLIGSCFIAKILVGTMKLIRQRQGRLVFCGLTPFCAEVLRLAQVDSLFSSFPTLKQAVAAAGAAD